MNDDTALWRAAGELFSAALERTDAERTAFLRESCTDNPVLYEAVRQLLDAHARTGSLPGQSAADIVAAALWAVTASLQPGTQVGGYVIERRLGEGGMGAVYLAQREVEDRQQRVALKVANESLRNDEMLERLRAERRILASLEHPNIARLVDFGELPDGRPYFAMEYVDGTTITQHCRDRKLDLRQRLHLFQALCDAVAYAHRRFVLHRDLKPSNVLVDVEGRVRLLDFGIAKALPDAQPETPADVTEIDRRFFSLTTAAPEQIRGQATTVATDVYGLGTLLYELLGDRPAFSAEGLARSEIELAVLDADPILPSRLAPDKRRARMLRGDLDAIVSKCLRKSPESRYESVEALSADVTAHLASRPISVRGGDRWYRAGRYVQRHRAAVGLVTLLVAATTVYAWLALEQARNVAAERDHAVQALAVANSERARAESMLGFLTDAFQGADPTRAKGHPPSVEELLTTAANTLPIKLKDQPETMVAMAQTLAILFVQTERIDLAGEQARRAAEMIAKLPAPSTSMETRQLLVDASIANADNEYAKSAELSRKGLEKFARAGKGELDPELRYRFWYFIGTGDANKVGAREAAATFARGISELEQAEDNDPRWTMALRRFRAVQLDVFDTTRPEARGEFEAVLAWQNEHLDPLDSERLLTLSTLAASMTRAKEHAAAEPLSREAVNGYARIYGADSLVLARAKNRLSTILRELGRIDEAEALALDALRVSRLRNGEDNWYTAGLHYNLGILYFDGFKDPKRAEFEYRESLRTFHGQGVFIINEALYTYALAQSLIVQKRYREAEVELKEAAPLLEERVPAGDGSIAEVNADLAVVAFYQGRRTEARNILVKWMDSIRKNRAPDEWMRAHIEAVARELGI